jgi:hypothetical protein
MPLIESFVSLLATDPPMTHENYRRIMHNLLMLEEKLGSALRKFKYVVRSTDGLWIIELQDVNTVDIKRLEVNSDIELRDVVRERERVCEYNY